MVKLNSLFTSVSLGLLSFTGGSAAAQNLYKRYDNSTTSCSTATSVSAVSVYGPAYSGAVSHQYSVPTIVGEWVDAPVWSIYIPQDVYNFTGLELVLNHLTSGVASADAYTLYSGDIGNFVNPGAIYSKGTYGITFDGKTQAPLLKIVFSPSVDSSASSFSVDFTLALDIIPSGSFAKKDIQSFDLTSTINKPGSFSSSVPVSSSAASASSESISETSTSSAAILSSSSLSATHSTAATASTVSSTVCTEAHCTNIGSTVTTKTTSSETITSCADGKCTDKPAPVPSSGSVVTTKTTFDKTITSCSDGKCTETSVTSAPGTPVIVGSTTTLTVTSCADHGCTLHTVPAVGSVITTTVSQIVSIYTTYCPIAPTGSTTTVPSAPASSVVTTIVPGAPTSSVATTTAAPSGSTITFTSSTSITPATVQSSSSISIYVAGANDLRANALTGGIAGLIAGFALMM